MLDPTLQLLALVGNDFVRICLERCCLHARAAGGRLNHLVHPSGMATVGGCLDLSTQALPVLISTAAGGLLDFALSCSETVACAMPRVLLVSQQGYPFGFCDWLHFFPVHLEPVSIIVFFPSERRHGRVVKGVTEVRSFGITVFGCRLVSKLLLKGVGRSWLGRQ